MSKMTFRGGSPLEDTWSRHFYCTVQASVFQGEGTKYTKV